MYRPDKGPDPPLPVLCISEEREENADACYQAVAKLEEIKQEVEIKIREKPLEGEEMQRVTMMLEELCHTDDPQKNFSELKQIGSGVSSVVYTATRKSDNQIVALKVINNVKKRFLLNEISLMRKLKHENLINLLDAYWDRQQEELWLVLDYIDGGSLTDVVTETVLHETQIAYVTHEVLKGIHYLHSKGVIHRDIKSDNVLVSYTGQLKLIDLGFSVEINKDSTRNTTVGTYYWMAPEVVTKKDYNNKVRLRHSPW